jgi:site-specific DNA recombinase
MNFAFYGRVSTEDQQDPASSKQWQLSRSTALIQPQGGVIVAEYFDVGLSRSLPWKRRPESTRLLDALANPDRGFDAVVIGEPARAFYGDQFGQTFPVFDHYKVGQWVPEMGGPIDPDSDAHEMIMNLYGGMSKGERNRIQTRVRSSMSAQAKHEGRFLGGRPPYGYTLADVSPHPNPSKAAEGRQLHRLEPDPTAAPVVARIFQEYLTGRGFYAIAEGLTQDGVLSPSGHDPRRNRHRRTSNGAWSKSAVRGILKNPRYTGYEVWNKQRRDEVLLDVDDVALGKSNKMRWNAPEDWIFSDSPSHIALVEVDTFERVKAQMTLGARRSTTTTRKSRHPYLFRGIVHCSECGRRMQGSWNNGIPHYRCRYASEYAAKEEVDHPKNVYFRQDAVEPLLDGWLTSIFDAEHIEETCQLLAEANMAIGDKDLVKREAVRRSLADCDRRLVQYRKLLDEGCDPKVASQWISEVQAERLVADRVLGTLIPTQSLTAGDMRRLIDSVEDKVRMLTEADTEDKAALYAELGIRLTYDPNRKVVNVEAQPDSWALDRVGGGTRYSAPRPVVMDSGWSELRRSL